MGRFRRHTIEEKRARSKRRKEAKKSTKHHRIPDAEILHSRKQETTDVVNHAHADCQDQDESSTSHYLGEDQTVNDTSNVPESSGENTKANDEAEETSMKAERFKKHAMVFYSKWKNSERCNVPILKESELKVTDTQIGRGSFGRCLYGQFGQLEVVIKKVAVTRFNSILEAKEEARLLNRLRHPHISILVGYVEKPSELWVITRFHSYRGESLCLGKASESKCLGNEFTIYLRCLLQVCSAIEYLHCFANVLHNDIKGNNVVLEPSVSDHKLPHATLIDFGKARDKYCPKSYSTGADTTVYKHLAPELGSPGGKQSLASDVYSFGYLLKRVSVTLEDVTLQNVYSACTRKDSKKRPTITIVHEALKKL